MDIKNRIIAEIERETHNTLRILNNLTDEHWEYKPHEKSMSLGALTSHIVELHHWVYLAITKDSFDFHTDYQAPNATNVAELKKLLEESLLKSKAFVNTQTTAFWSTDWILKAGAHILYESSKIEAYRFIITNHLIHHRGQLTVYMRLLNIPLPGIYGPSADEK